MKHDRKVIENAIVALQDDSGRVAPGTVVKAAMLTDSPLHTLFEWDDAKAGHAYRLEQARELLRSFKVSMIVEEKQVNVVMYVRDPEAERDEQGYISTMRVRDDPEAAAKVLNYELSRAEACIVRAESIADAFSMRGSLVTIRGKIQRLRKRLA